MKKLFILFLIIALASCQKEADCIHTASFTFEITDFRRVIIANDEKSAIVWFNFQKYETQSIEIVAKLKERISTDRPFALDVFLNVIQDVRPL